MYGSTTEKRRIDNAFKVLEYVYSKMPETKGCLEHISKPKEEGGCGAWCCQLQNPQVLYSEFLYTWNHVVNNWNDNQIGDLIEACLHNYLFDTPVKGCVFFDKESKKCSQHDTRPYNCRVYGIIPDEEFRPRYERLKVLNNDVQYQCQLVETADGSKVTPKNTEDWWKQIRSVEMAIGIKEDLITDEPEGSYRTYHDHILLHLFGEELLENLTAIRMSDDKEAKEATIRVMMQSYYNLKITNE